jgi:FixJ family two-component response regulator
MEQMRLEQATDPKEDPGHPDHVSAFGNTLRATTLPTRKSVFVVDDDPSMLRGMKRLLRQHGFDAKLFDSAGAMLSHDDFGAAFCIILDINLNDESGLELHRRLVDEGVMLPVIYITGNDSPGNRRAAMESGCAAYLTKPFTAKSLIEPIERMSARPT